MSARSAALTCDTLAAVEKMAAGDRDLGSVLTSVIVRWPLLLAGVVVFGAVGTVNALTSDPVIAVQRSLTVDTGGTSSTNVADRSVENVVQTLNDPAFRAVAGTPLSQAQPVSATAVRSTDFVVVRAEAASAEQADSTLRALTSQYQGERVASVQQAQQALNDEYAGRVTAIDQQIQQLSDGEPGEFALEQVSALATERTRLQSELATRLASVQVALPSISVGDASKSVESVSQKVIKLGVVWAALGLAIGVASALASIFLSRRFRRYSDLGLWLPPDVLHAPVPAADSAEVNGAVIKKLQLLGLGSGPRRLGLIAVSEGRDVRETVNEARAWFVDLAPLSASGDSVRAQRSVDVQPWQMEGALPFVEAKVGVMLVEKGVERSAVLNALALARSVGCDHWAVLWVSPGLDHGRGSEPPEDPSVRLDLVGADSSPTRTSPSPR